MYLPCTKKEEENDKRQYIQRMHGKGKLIVGDRNYSLALALLDEKGEMEKSGDVHVQMFYKYFISHSVLFLIVLNV